MVSSTCHLKMIEKQTDIDTLCLFIDLAADRTTEVLTVLTWHTSGLIRCFSPLSNQFSFK